MIIDYDYNDDWLMTIMGDDDYYDVYNGQLLTMIMVIMMVVMMVIDLDEIDGWW